LKCKIKSWPVFDQGFILPSRPIPAVSIAQLAALVPDWENPLACCPSRVVAS